MKLGVFGPLACTMPLLVACADDTGITDDTGVTDDPPVGAETIVFQPSLEVSNFATGVPSETVDAQQVLNTLLAATGVVASETFVQERMITAGDATLGVDVDIDDLPSQGSICWDTPPFPLPFDLDVTYEPGCPDFGGGVQLTLPSEAGGSSLLLVEFLPMDVTNRSLGGALALDREGSFPAPLHWSIYNTERSLLAPPGPDNRVPIGATLDDGSQRGITYDGGASIDFLTNEWIVWGTATLSGEPPVTVVHGAEDVADVRADDPPGDALRMNIEWPRDCLCPETGVTTYDMQLQVTSVDIDLDDLEVEPDRMNDVEIEVPTDHVIAGRAVLDYVACGEYTVDYRHEAEQLTFMLPTEAILGRIQFACDTAAIDDEQRCDALLRAANALGEGLIVNLDSAEVNAAATAAVDAEFDTGWCRI